MTALHVFDMDGTLLRGTTAGLELARRLDRSSWVQELERQFATGRLSATEFSLRISTLWAELDDALVADVATAAPWIDGIPQVCADIKARGETSMLITMSPNFFARHLLTLGLDLVHGSAFPPLPLTSPVDPAGLLDPTDKVRLTDTTRAQLGLPLTACVAYGDSTSDEPLFAHLPHTVAVNAAPQLEKLAQAVYHGDDLQAAYALGRALLDEPTAQTATGT